MASPYTLFEISWEVCNKVGGIHTVLSTKAETVLERLGDDYVTIGPWLLSEGEREVPFDEDDEGFEAFRESCRERGIPVRVGRWRIPGRPRTLLIEFSSLYDQKDGILAGLWEDYGVDSLHGSWDYVEPVLFGWAAGIVIEEWMEHFLAPSHRRGIAHAHEWMTSASLLYLKTNAPSIGTVFTTHATMLGRALSSVGQSPDDGLDGQSPAELATTHGVAAKHSLEGIAAREADVFATVSEITAREAELLHERAPDPVTPNGIDLDVIDALAGEATRDDVRSRLNELAGRFLGCDVSNAAFHCVSGRYEFHNKGMDFLLEAAQRLNGSEGPPLVLFFLVPAGNSGIKGELQERLRKPLHEIDGPMGLSTHNLFDEENDPVHVHCAKLGLENAPGDRVKIVQIPCYLSETDGILNLPYEAVLRAMDASAFPSYYEPWGYTPQESLALGVPTVTTDYAGFGRWARDAGIQSDEGVTVLSRVHVEYATALQAMTDELERLLRSEVDAQAMRTACRKTAARTAWSDLFRHYDTAYQTANDAVHERLKRGVQQKRRPRQKMQIQNQKSDSQPRLRHFEVSSTLPKELNALQRLSRNFWWCWDPEAPSLFSELDPEGWQESGHNPVRLLQIVSPKHLKARSTDKAYLAKLERVAKRFDAYCNADPTKAEWRKSVPKSMGKALSGDAPIAYFCAEYGIQESLRIYSGGLGVLAGDHLKSASDLGLPFVAVGLFYRKGYLTQELSTTSDQIALPAENDPLALPVELVKDADGNPLELSLPLPGRKLIVRAWLVRVGRVSLYLLDADCPANSEEDRDITSQLYGGESKMRLKQEIVLGRGGVRLLRRLGIQPTVFHMNEGHAAFITLERVSALLREGLTFEEARETVRASTLFTTHTPVPAGHDRFAEDLIRRYFSDAEEWVGVPWDDFYAFGRTDDGGDFNMTYLALHFSAYCNGVSKLHGVASRKLLQPYWPNLLESEVPVDAITNGIHLGTWTHPAIAAALGVADRSIRPADFGKPTAKALSAAWKAKQEIKAELIAKLRERMRKSFVSRHDSPVLLEQALAGLNPDALVIGFARRFAPYKRAHLLFQDLERLQALVSDTERPVIFLIGGKAHPRDERGKDILKGIAEIARSQEFVGKVFFVEDYDMDIARSLVQGVDVWLNNPTRMLEASGTSGMKVSANGGLNLSIGDGWWPEAYDGGNGWRIADDRVYEDQSLQDQFDSGALYRLLEEEVVPTFFERNKSGVPARWLEMMRNDLETIPAVFNTDRMVLDYTQNAYARLSRPSANEVKKTVQHVLRVRRAFGEIAFRSVEMGDLSEAKVGETIDVRVEVDLGSLAADDVRLELVLGPRGDGNDLVSPAVIELKHLRQQGDAHVFEGSHAFERSGRFGFGLRARPRTDDRTARALSDLALWA